MHPGRPCCLRSKRLPSSIPLKLARVERAVGRRLLSLARRRHPWPPWPRFWHTLPLVLGGWRRAGYDKVASGGTNGPGACLMDGRLGDAGPTSSGGVLASLGSLSGRASDQACAKGWTVCFP